MAWIRRHAHLLLCTNSLYLQHAAVCLTSLLKNNADLLFEIVIAGREGEVLDEEKLQRTLAQFPNCSVSFCRFTPPADRNLPLNARAHYTLDNWTRLWMERFFPAEVDRILYLDSDIVVVGSIAPLWGANLEGALLGAVDIPGSLHGATKLGMRAEDGYFNSGVLLIDLKQWRETHALDTLLARIDEHPEQFQYTLDQDALNACFHARTKRLEYKWNVTWPFFSDPSSLPLSSSEVEAVLREARIVHFNGSSKPWNYLCDHPRKVEYEKYLRMTEWREFVPSDQTIINKMRKTLSALLPPKAKRILQAAFASRPA